MMEQPPDGRHRIVVERVSPEIDCGRFAIKRVVGEIVSVEADVFSDGHDQAACRVLYWKEGQGVQTSPMRAIGNDRGRGEFSVTAVGQYKYTVEGWIDHFRSWQASLEKRVAAGQDVHVELLIGAELVEKAAARAADS